MHERLPQIDSINYEDDEITLKEILSVVKKYWKVVQKMKWRILGFSILIGFAASFYAMQQEKTYTAKYTFMLQEHLGRNRFVDPYRVYGSSVKINFFKVVAFIKSKRIIHNALRHSNKINNKEDLLINHFSNIYGFGDFKKDSTEILSKESLKMENKLNVAYGKIIGGIMKLDYANQTEIYSLSVKTLNKELSLKLIEAIYQENTSFYIEKSIEKSKYVYDVLVQRIDSVEQQLNLFQEQLILSEDRNRNLFSNRHKIKQEKLKQEIQVLKNIYGKLYENKETTSFDLNNQTPIFQSIDTAGSTVRATKPSVIKAFCIGSISASFLFVLFIILIKVIRDAIETE